MSDKYRSQTKVTMRREKLARVIDRAEIGLATYCRWQQDEAIKRMREHLLRPRSLWEKLFRIKRPDTSEWKREDWLRVATEQFYKVSLGTTWFYDTPWDTGRFREETSAIRALHTVLLFAEEEGTHEVSIDVHDLQLIENISTWAPAQIANYRAA